MGQLPLLNFMILKKWGLVVCTEVSCVKLSFVNVVMKFYVLYRTRNYLIG